MQIQEEIIFNACPEMKEYYMLDPIIARREHANLFSQNSKESTSHHFHKNE